MNYPKIVDYMCAFSEIIEFNNKLDYAVQENNGNIDLMKRALKEKINKYNKIVPKEIRHSLRKKISEIENKCES